MFVIITVGSYLKDLVDYPFEATIIIIFILKNRFYFYFFRCQYLPLFNVELLFQGVSFPHVWVSLYNALILTFKVSCECRHPGIVKDDGISSWVATLVDLSSECGTSAFSGICWCFLSSLALGPSFIATS